MERQPRKRGWIPELEDHQMEHPKRPSRANERGSSQNVLCQNEMAEVNPAAEQSESSLALKPAESLQNPEEYYAILVATAQVLPTFRKQQTPRRSRGFAQLLHRIR